VSFLLPRSTIETLLHDFTKKNGQTNFFGKFVLYFLIKFTNWNISPEVEQISIKNMILSWCTLESCMIIHIVCNLKFV